MTGNSDIRQGPLIAYATVFVQSQMRENAESTDCNIVIKSGTRLNVWLLQPGGSFVMKLLHNKLRGSDGI